MSLKKIGELMVEKNIFSPEELSSFIQASDQNQDPHFPLLGHTNSTHYLSHQQLNQLIGTICKALIVCSEEMEWDMDVLDLIPNSFAQKHMAIPVQLVKNETEMIVACKKPLPETVVEHLRKTTLKEIRQLLLTPDDFADLYQKAFPGSQPMNLIQEDIGDSEKQAVELVDQILLQSIEKRASDIHIEPTQSRTRIRIRIDGILHTIGEISKEITKSVISRLKILAQLDITNRFVPQEGSFIFSHIELDTPPVNVRISVLPGGLGEKTVLRLLPPEEALIQLNELGMHKTAYDTIIRSLQHPNGMILVTGPAASGKSTTMYSLLNYLREEKINISTIEDPLEMIMTGVNQFQVDPSNQLMFSEILHALLRQDPDIIMVGEIRNAKTAEIALQAGLTGHQVFATLHTNDAPSAFTRLIEMGCDPYLVASSVRTVISQRLIRKVCSHCRAKRAPRDEELHFYGFKRELIPEVAFGKGCPHCHGTGFSGRTGIFEILPVDDELQMVVLQNPVPGMIGDIMKSKNIMTLQQDGISKLKQGITTIEEVANAIHLKGN